MCNIYIHLKSLVIASYLHPSENYGKCFSSLNDFILYCRRVQIHIAPGRGGYGVPVSSLLFYRYIYVYFVFLYLSFYYEFAIYYPL